MLRPPPLAMDLELNHSLKTAVRTPIALGIRVVNYFGVLPGWGGGALAQALSLAKD